MKTLKETPDFDVLMGTAVIDTAENAVTEKMETAHPPTEKDGATEETKDICSSDCRQWERFMTHLSSDDSSDKTTRMACKIDRELAETLDEIDISRRCRSDLVNAIVKSFLDIHLSELSAYRRKSASLLNNIVT